MKKIEPPKEIPIDTGLEYKISIISYDLSHDRKVSNMMADGRPYRPKMEKDSI